MSRGFVGGGGGGERAMVLDEIDSCIMRGSCGKVRAGACKHPSGWRPKFSVKFGDGGTQSRPPCKFSTTITTQNYIRLRSTNFLEWNYTRSLWVNSR